MPESKPDSDDAQAGDDSGAPQILLSMKNAVFKSIVYRHFRTLGTKRDREAEAPFVARVFQDLTRHEGDDAGDKCVFYKVKKDKRVFMSREEVLEFIRDTIKNRYKTTHLWIEEGDDDTIDETSQSLAAEKEGSKEATNALGEGENDDERAQTENSQSGLNPPSAVQDDPPTAAESDSRQQNFIEKSATNSALDKSDDDETLAAIAASKLKRKSPRVSKQKASYEEADNDSLIDEEEEKDNVNEEGDNDQEDAENTNSQSADIQLSMLDPYYKQTLFHYYQNRKSSSRTQHANEIYTKFRKKLEHTGGGFYKIEHKGGDWYLVESEKDILKKIKSDLGKKDRYEKEMASTIVLDLESDAKYAKIMHSHYNFLGLERDDEQEKDEARVILNELKQKYNSFVIIEAGDRVEVDKEDEDTLLEMILDNIQQREESKATWFDEQASASDRKRPRQDPVSNNASVAAPEEPSATSRKRRSNAASDQDTTTSRKKGYNAAADQNSTTSRKRRATTSPQSDKRLNHKQQPKQSRSETKPKRIRGASTSPPSFRTSTFSPLNDRLPQKKMLTVLSRTPIKTVSQLVQIVQFATHKLNELYGSTKRHCKVLRLYQLVELGGDMTGIPTLAELAKSMATSQSNIRKWCEMCQAAERRGFDFLRYGNDSIDNHSGIFDTGEGDYDVFMLKKCGETAMEQFFDGAAVNALKEFENGDSGDTNEAQGREVSLSAHENQESHAQDESYQSNEILKVSVDKVSPAAADEPDKVDEKTITQEATHDQTESDDGAISPADGSPGNIFQNSEATQEQTEFIQSNDATNNPVDRDSDDLLHYLDVKSEQTELEHDKDDTINHAVPKDQASEAADDDVPDLSSHRKTGEIQEPNYQVLGAPIADHANDKVAVDQKCNETKHANQSSSDSVEPPLDDIPSDDATTQESATEPEVCQHQQKPSEEDVNASFHEIKCSIAQISDAIGARTESVTDYKAEKIPGVSVDDSPKQIVLQPDNTPDESSEVAKDVNMTFNAEDSAIEINGLKPQMNGDKSVDDTDTSTTNSDAQQDEKFDHLLNQIEKGSRIVVKWGKTGDLYRATVKKILANRDEPSLKVHYDGKKSHIVDTISLDMVEGFIEEEGSDSEHDAPSPVHEARKSQPVEAINKLLRGRYQISIPDGKLEHREQCPELGPGWTVYVVACKDQLESGTRADRYFISPSGKSCRGIPVLEKHYIQHPEEFDLCSTYHETADVDQEATKYDEKGDDVVHDEAESLPNIADGKNGKAVENQRSGSHPTPDAVVDETDDIEILPEVNAGKPISNDVTELMASTPSRGGIEKSIDDQTHSSTENAASYSPLMIGESAQGIEESHSDHEFLSSLMDERGLLFGDEDDASSCLNQQPSSSEGTEAQPLEACALKPITSLNESPSPDSEVKKDASGSPKKVVHFTKQQPVSFQQEETEGQSEPPQQEETLEQADLSQEATEEHSGLSEPEATSVCLGCKKKALSPRMKRNKKSLVRGIVPVFAMETPADAEFAGYLGDGMLSDSDVQSDEEGPPIYRHHSLYGMRNAVAKYSKLSPIAARNPSKTSAFVRISPISLRHNKDDIINAQDSNKQPTDLHAGSVKLQNVVDQIGRESSVANGDKKPANMQNLSGTKSATSPNEVVVINLKPTLSAFVSIPRATRPGVAPPVFPPSSSPLRSVPGKVQLFAFNYDDEKVDESNQRPKRKLKSTVRFEPDMPDAQTNVKTGHGFLCPRCKSVCDYDSKVCVGCKLECYYEAGVGVVVLKERESVAASQTIAPLVSKPVSLSTHARPEGVLCNCTYCDKRHFSIQGIYAHHGRAHPYLGKLDWTKVSFSCPFCKSSEIFTLGEVEKHVRAHHPGSELVTPNTMKPQRNRSRNRGSMSPPPLNVHHDTRATRTKHSSISSDDTSHDADPVEIAPKWTKLDHRILLPDCKKDYPREISNIIDLVEDQCKAQEDVIATALEQRVKLCKAEAEMDAKAWDDDRLAYQRGIRERTRYADAERIEKQRFTESQKLVLMQYEYENRNRKRTRNEIEIEKLCSKPILFSGGKGRSLPLEKHACKYDECELCKEDSTYLQAVMLDKEMAALRTSQPPSSQNLPPPVSVLNPSFQVITGDYFDNTDFEDETEAAKANGVKYEGARKANLSRRDIATSKRLKIEEDRLFEMKNKQYSLQFVNVYNEGLIRDAWKNNEPKYDKKKTR